MKVCGLTGGVGMGKSTAAGFLLSHGARVIDTDEIARRLVRPGQPALAEIADAFGKNLLAPDGTLRRDELAKIVFADPAAREKLEAILHPRIREHWLAQIAAWRGELAGAEAGPPASGLAVVVIPLLFETRAESQFDQIICIACSSAAQHERLAARGWLPEQISRRIAAQMPVEEKIARSDFVVWTDGALEVHRRQVARIVRRL